MNIRLLNITGHMHAESHKFSSMFILNDGERFPIIGPATEGQVLNVDRNVLDFAQVLKCEKVPGFFVVFTITDEPLL